MKLYRLGQDARDCVKDGIDFVANHTKFTLGPAGRGALIGRHDLSPRIVDDAITIVMNLEHTNELVNESVKMMREALSLTSKKVKDATATTITLSQAIANALHNELKDSGSLIKKNKINSITLKKQVDKIYEEVIKRLKDKSRPITKDEIYSVALTAGSYEWIARIVADVYEKVGMHGYVTVEEGHKTGYEICNGVEIKTGYHDENFINNDERQCVLKDTNVFITNQSLDVNALVKIVTSLFAKGLKSTVIIAPEFTREALTEMTKTHLEYDEKTRFTAVGLKLPTYDKNDVLVDIATMTGGKFMDRNLFTSYDEYLKAIDATCFGTIDKAVIGDSSTMLMGGKGDTKERVKELIDQKEKVKSIFDKDAIEKRIGSLEGGIAIIKIKNNSDVEGEYYRLKIENAVASVENALKEGVVRGGGIALKEVAEDMEKNIITEALKAPYNQIQENNGEPFEVAENVFDPLINVVGALKSAGHIAGNMLLIESLNTNKNEPSKNQSQD